MSTSGRAFCPLPSAYRLEAIASGNKVALSRPAIIQMVLEILNFIGQNAGGQADGEDVLDLGKGPAYATCERLLGKTTL